MLLANLSSLASFELSNRHVTRQRQKSRAQRQKSRARQRGGGGRRAHAQAVGQ